jgi:hypothetical protein
MSLFKRKQSKDKDLGDKDKDKDHIRENVHSPTVA